LTTPILQPSYSRSLNPSASMMQQAANVSIISHKSVNSSSNNSGGGSIPRGNVSVINLTQKRQSTGTVPRKSKNAQREHQQRSTIDVSLMPPAGNPSQSPDKKSGKKLHRDIIMEESESPEIHQQSGQKPNGQQASLEGSQGLTTF